MALKDKKNHRPFEGQAVTPGHLLDWTYLRPLASLNTAAPGSTARASSSCTSSRRDFFTVRRVLREQKIGPAHSQSASLWRAAGAQRCWHRADVAGVNVAAQGKQWAYGFPTVFIQPCPTYAVQAKSLSKQAVGTRTRPSQKCQHCITLPACNDNTRPLLVSHQSK